ncbi:hypothetical protein ACFQGR_04560 [Weissella sagaensis]|uniref:Uncharacterized protein n=1 Tax=Weissella sagaensis TaxID=2559928 RepID=A0ABW1RT56_9LACO|nr:hypothetical protein [Weissella sagaensis]
MGAVTAFFIEISITLAVLFVIDRIADYFITRKFGYYIVEENDLD